MSRKLIIVIGAVLAVALVGTAIAIPGLAQEPTPAPEPRVPFGWGGRGFAPGRGWLGFGVRGRSWATYDAAAEALGLTPEQLFNELHADKRLADIAEAQGVDLDKVQEAMQAVHTEAIKEAIQQAVTEERLTQEQADWLLKGLDLGFVPGRWGPGMRGHFGRFVPRQAPSTAAPSSPSL
jgi:hypothetical protein